MQVDWQEECGLGPAGTIRQGIRLIHSRMMTLAVNGQYWKCPGLQYHCQLDLTFFGGLPKFYWKMFYIKIDDAFVSPIVFFSFLIDELPKILPKNRSKNSNSEKSRRYLRSSIHLCLLHVITPPLQLESHPLLSSPPLPATPPSSPSAGSETSRSQDVVPSFMIESDEKNVSIDFFAFQIDYQSLYNSLPSSSP